jgi:hypothetical protein
MAPFLAGIVRRLVARAHGCEPAEQEYAVLNIFVQLSGWRARVMVFLPGSRGPIQPNCTKEGETGPVLFGTDQIATTFRRGSGARCMRDVESAADSGIGLES